MRSSEALEEALGTAGGSGRLSGTGSDGTATIDAVAVGPIGVRVRSVEIGREAAVGVAEAAASLPARLRALPDPIVPVEVDPGLGGAILRSAPAQMQDRESWEIAGRPLRTTIRKQRVGEDGLREETDFTLTRDQLRRLVDQAHG